MIMSCFRKLRVKHEESGVDRIKRRPAFVRMVWRESGFKNIEPLIPSPTALRYSCAVLTQVLIGCGGDCRGIRDCTTSKVFPCVNNRQQTGLSRERK